MNNIENMINQTSHLKLAIVSMLIGIVAAIIAFVGFDVELSKFANKLLNAGIVFFSYMLYKIYFFSRGFKTDEKIAENPIAVAIDNGLLCLAIAWSVAGGF
jgi:hypothetical protein